ncbi:MAG: F0F1 ATP synthase subunit epsilon [Nitratireductor sp.]|jgi:F-type H+-transporting ATPase subunit epsilon|nr:F0F1 ATP synthase subunit epsilon [Nitratireductor sp.]
MAQEFKFDLVSPERLLLSERVDAVVVPGTDGDMTVMALHAPTMTTVRPGVVTVMRQGNSEKFVVFGGFADITPEGCTLLAESAVRVADLDRADLDRNIQMAREDVRDAKDDAARSKSQEHLDHLLTLQAAL